ncbi:Txe/YoeB family addiction module toxin [Streptomyces sp. 5.8]|uniref:Txe/YoeB family addiction module toxin n=1 Tax=Streptomyces sp. 5.8 TaxID=3406571 RepID=UPI003BB7CB0B
MRSVHIDPAAWDDFLFWLASDRKMARRITRLIGEIQRDPFGGIGKPEPLKGELSGYWSRRIDDEHRLVCRAAHRGRTSTAPPRAVAGSRCLQRVRQPVGWQIV